MIAVIPMAGRGSRFSNKGFETPKPLIPVAGKPMLLWALKSLENVPVSRIVFVALREHEEQYNISGMLKKHLNIPIDFRFLDDVTQGQLCTVLESRDIIDTDEDVLIASSDTWVVSDLGKDMAHSEKEGLISVFDLPGEQWSFACVNDQGEVVEVAEKKRISPWASTGLYYFRHGNTLVRFADQMISAGETTRGEYYVIPVYQKMIATGLRVGISKANAMWDMGTPESKAAFEKYIEERSDLK